MAQTDRYSDVLHLALLLRHGDEKAARSLLRRAGVDLNRTNDDKETLLHLICKMNDGLRVLYDFFEISEIQSLADHNSKLASLLLSKGDKPNLSDFEGTTLLHVICKRSFGDDLAELFFKINDELNLTVQVDAKDNQGQTPLQWAVACVLPNAVDVLLDRGAGLSSFAYPDESHFGTSYVPLNSELWHNCRLRLASGALMIAQRLEQRGYELKDSDYQHIIALFVKHQMFEKLVDLEEPWYEDEEFARRSRTIMVNADLSLHDLIRMGPDEASSQLTYRNYYELGCSAEFHGLPERVRDACDLHLSEKLSRPFFQHSEQRAFSKLPLDQRIGLNRRRKRILKQLSNEQLCKLFLSVAC